MPMDWIALANLLVGVSSALTSGIQGYQNNKLQKEQQNNELRSSYFSYMDQLASMTGQLAETQSYMNSNLENIATNRNYLDRWSSEYDLTMQNAVDETFGQYQQMASNLGTGLVTSGESGNRGSMSLLNAGAANTLRTYNGGTDGLRLNNRLGAYLSATSLDMLADKQTAMSSLENSYRAIPMYQSAMSELNKAINGDTANGTKGMTHVTEELRKTLKKKGMEV